MERAPRYEETIAVIDYCEGGTYDENLYAAAETARMHHGFEAADDAAIEQFHELGYICIEDAFTPKETADALEGLIDLVDGKNPDFKELQFEAWAADRLSSMTCEEKQRAVRKLMAFHTFDPRLEAIALHPKLLTLVRRLQGGGDPRILQDIALLKPPGGREKPWHQDMAYFNYPVDTPVVGVWIALDEATVENGCMHVLPGAHRGGPQLHFMRRDWQICDDQVLGRRSVACPMKPGGALFFHGLLPHGTPTNHSERTRRAVQHHYVPAPIEETSEAQRLAVFGSEGKNVTC